MTFNFGKPPATISEIDTSSYVEPWHWPVSLSDEDLESLQESHSPYVTLLHACRCGSDLYYTARLAFAVGVFKVSAVWARSGHRWLSCEDAE
jgi:hypothetical protein